MNIIRLHPVKLSGSFHLAPANQAVRLRPAKPLTLHVTVQDNVDGTALNIWKTLKKKGGDCFNRLTQKVCGKVPNVQTRR